MSLQMLTSFGVAAGLTGVLMTGTTEPTPAAPASPPAPPAAPMVAVVDEAPEVRTVHEAPDPDEIAELVLETRIGEYLLDARRKIAELLEAGRDEAAEALEREVESRLEAAEMLRDHVVEIHQRVRDLRESGRFDEAEELMQNAKARLQDLREQGRPEHLVVLEALDAREHLQDALRSIEKYHQSGQHEFADAIAHKIQAHLEELHDHAARIDREQEEIELVDELHKVEHEMQERLEEGEPEGIEELEREAQEVRAAIEHLHRRMDVPPAPRAPRVPRAEREPREPRAPRPPRVPRAEPERRDIRAPMPHRESGPDIESRVHHLIQAAENLEAAGFGDRANELRQHAEMMMREFEAQHARDHGPDDVNARLDMLTEEVHALRAEIHELIGLIEAMHDRMRERAERSEREMRPGRTR
jgi:tetratricopeptide (TPR) repeat protein